MELRGTWRTTSTLRLLGMFGRITTACTLDAIAGSTVHIGGGVCGSEGACVLFGEGSPSVALIVQIGSPP